MSADDHVDLLVIGGGVNGAGIARDAAGRGLSVLLCEKDDLAQGTSSRSGKLVHGGLRYLEYYEFRLVREALIEREVLLRRRAAHHLADALRAAAFARSSARPGWCASASFSTTISAAASSCRRTRAIDLAQRSGGRADQGRLHARPSNIPTAGSTMPAWSCSTRSMPGSAAPTILTRTAAAVGPARRRCGWTVELGDAPRTDAAGARPLHRQCRRPLGRGCAGRHRRLVSSNRRVRLVKGSHIVTRKFWDGDQAYLLQNHDKRVIFVNPYEGDLALIGTTDIAVEGKPEDAAIDDREIDYLLAVLARYFDARRAAPTSCTASPACGRSTTTTPRTRRR